MLWNALSIIDYRVAGSDGVVGRISDMLFSDTDWIIPWVVVDMGDIQHHRDVLLPTAALGSPDVSQRVVPVRLTVKQIKESPDSETHEPVSRKLEKRLYDFYGHDPYWTESLYLTPRRPDGDTHLRSIADLAGYQIEATDGEIGHIEDCLVDDRNWTIKYLVVDTGDLWSGRKVLISPKSVKVIDWAGRLVALTVDRHTIRAAPPYTATSTIDGGYIRSLMKHYDLGGARF